MELLRSPEPATNYLYNSSLPILSISNEISFKEISRSVRIESVEIRFVFTNGIRIDVYLP